MIIRKQDGAFLYATTDLATIQYRVETWSPDAILYVVDHRQSLHFEQLFAAARLWGYDRARARARQLRHGAGRRRPAVQNPLGRHGRPVGTARRSGAPGPPGRQRKATTPSRAAPRFRPSGGSEIAESGRHRRAQVRRPVAEPHQRLHVQLRQDAGHERQHGHVHAVRLRPRAEHLCQGRRRRRQRCAPQVAAIRARASGRAGLGDGAGAVLRSAGQTRRPSTGPISSRPTCSSWPTATRPSSSSARCSKRPTRQPAPAGCCCAI